MQQFYGCSTACILQNFSALRFALLTNQIARILVGVVQHLLEHPRRIPSIALPTESGEKKLCCDSGLLNASGVILFSLVNGIASIRSKLLLFCDKNEYCKSGYFRAINFSRSANSDEFRGFLISRRVGDHFVKLLVQRPSHRCHTRYTVHNCM